MTWLTNLIAPFLTMTWVYGSGILVLLGAVIWYAPTLKIKLAAAGIALVIASGLYGYTKGYRDGSSDVQEKWNRAESAAVQIGKDARAGGESDAATDSLRDPNDRYYQKNNH
jgi:hypothetical protein